MKKKYGFKLKRDAMEAILLKYGTARKFATDSTLGVATVSSIFNGGYASDKARKKISELMGREVKDVFVFETYEDNKKGAE